jgi:hypothetical protein
MLNPPQKHCQGTCMAQLSISSGFLEKLRAVGGMEYKTAR